MLGTESAVRGASNIDLTMKPSLMRQSGHDAAGEMGFLNHEQNSHQLPSRRV